MKLLIASLFLSAFASYPIASGISGENLADTPVGDAVNMYASRPTTQIALEMVVTPGTSLVVHVTCEESANSTTWGAVTICDTTSPTKLCVPEERKYTLADFPLVSTVKRISSVWQFRKQFARCTFDDPADGTGTLVVTGDRSGGS